MKFFNTTHPMKQTALKTTFTLIVGLVFFTQCRKDKHIPFCEQYPDQCIEMEHIKDHYYFKTGSWWVYEEQNTGAIDSQWVSKSWSDGCMFEITLKNSLNDYDNNYWTKQLTKGKGCCEVKKNDRAAFVKQNITKAGSYIGELNISAFPYKIGDSTYNYIYNIPNNHAYLITIHDSLSFLNNTFYNILEYKLNYDPIQNKQKTNYFYAKNIGLIKKELIDSNQVWLLKKYNVEQ